MHPYPLSATVQLANYFRQSAVVVTDIGIFVHIKSLHESLQMHFYVPLKLVTHYPYVF